MRPRSWRVTAAASAAVALTLLTTAATSSAATASVSTDRAVRTQVPVSDRFAAPLAEWGPCDPGNFLSIEDGTPLIPANVDCAVYEVPLDYDRPRGEQIALTLVRRTADDPANRQGTLFLNFGGPTAGNTLNLAYGGETLFGPEVLARFDLVSLDPRGFGYSTPARCYPTTDALGQDLAADEFQRIWPVTDEDYRALLRDSRDLVADCTRDAGPVLRHMGTSNVARDLDVLRRAVGDPQLNFWGGSYGTQICAQYLAQYPGRVGALVCDGNIDPVEWTTGEPRLQGLWVPQQARQRTESGQNATLEEFFRLCDESANCAFGPDSRNRWYALRDGLRANPTPVLDDQTFVTITGSFLYGGNDSFFLLGQFLAEIEAAVAGELPPAPEEPAPGEQPPPEEEPVILPPANEIYEGPENILSVFCSDGIEPRFLSAWRRAIERSAEPFGPFWASADYGCSVWPFDDRDAYLGRFNQRTANPVLVVNTVFDAATPYEDAVDFQRRLPNSALVTVEGSGHVANGRSDCADAIVDQYLLTRTVPARAVTCPQDVVPFQPEVFDPLLEPDGDARSATPGANALAGEGSTVDEAIDAILATLAESGDPDAAVAQGTLVLADGLAEAGQEELAEDIEARVPILENASPAGTPGPPDPDVLLLD